MRCAYYRAMAMRWIGANYEADMGDCILSSA